MRKIKLADCDPKWVADSDGHIVGLRFSCPEADGGCEGYHVVPCGPRGPDDGGARWTITGEIPNVTIDPSLRCSGACRMHIKITNGEIEFGADSLSGPDWPKTH